MNWDNVDKEIEAGYISVRKHPSLDLLPQRNRKFMKYHELALEMLPAVQAASEGKTILVRRKGSNNPWEKKVCLSWDPSLFEYKVEEPPKLVPYSADKWHEITRVKNKKTGESYAVGMVTDEKVVIGGYSHPFKIAMEYYTHINGDPLGD